MTSIYRFVLIAVLCSSAVSYADAVAQLNQLFQGMDTLQGRFQQTIVGRNEEVLQQASGLLQVKRPHQLKWFTQEPYQHQIITDGNILWVYDLDLEQATRQAFASNLDQAPALLLSGDITAISERFTISQILQSDGGQRFQLQPRLEGSVFSSIVIGFVDQQLSELLLSDNFGQQTRIVFSDLQINKLIADEQFQFVPPEQVDVINDEE